MNTKVKTSIVFLIISTFACSHQQNKKEESLDTIPKKQTSEKLFIPGKDGVVLKGEQTKEDIATKILTTSPRYKQLTKGLNEKIVQNGGLYFGIRLEGSPNQRINMTLNYSETYDFTLFEMYVERQLNTAQFTFDPVSKLLYEHDEIHEKLVPIEFDKSLLLEFNGAL